jgi:hypothetical protein
VIGDKFLTRGADGFRLDEQRGVAAPVVEGSEKRLFYLDPIRVLLFGLLGHPACNHVELRSGPEERPAHANGTAIGYVGATIVSFWLRENMDSRLSREQSHV